MKKFLLLIGILFIAGCGQQSFSGEKNKIDEVKAEKLKATTTDILFVKKVKELKRDANGNKIEKGEVAEYYYIGEDAPVKEENAGTKKLHEVARTYSSIFYEDGKGIGAKISYPRSMFYLVGNKWKNIDKATSTLQEFKKETGIDLSKQARHWFVKEAKAEVLQNNTGAGGGYMDYSGTSNWALAHDATTAGSAGTGYFEISVSVSGAGLFYIERSTAPFNTKLPAGATISSSTLWAFIDYKNSTYNGTYSYLVLATSSPAATTTVTTADYNDFGVVEISNSINYSAFTVNNFYGFSLNAAGLAWIAKKNLLTGWTSLGGRAGWDITNNAIPGTSRTNNIGADTPGTAGHLYLKIVYTLPAPPSGETAPIEDFLFFE
jgi:hypothetical protein